MSFKKLKKKELLEIAKSNGIEASSKNTVAELVEILEDTISEPEPAPAPEEADRDIPAKRSHEKRSLNKESRSVEKVDGRIVTTDRPVGF